MSAPTKHTPTPWHVREWTCHAMTTIAVEDATAGVTGVRVVAECETPDDAARIVQCVNAHAGLVLALEQIERLSREADGTLVDVRAMLGDIARNAIRSAA